MRLIDADALMEKMKHRWERFGRESDCICLIEDAQTIDAVPVVHGEWKMGIDANGDPVTYCSNCKMPNYVQTNYCPDCGAKMNMKKGRSNIRMEQEGER